MILGLCSRLAHTLTCRWGTVASQPPAERTQPTGALDVTGSRHSSRSVPSTAAVTVVRIVDECVPLFLVEQAKIRRLA